ncbi:hypothetical protein [uncultured Flavobacterium sp.]|uniref:hypothetical protein n=1 Tax=uncultured Flavobacterium sp. TaxID=165435 RepID=UPI00292F0FA9|nr:hypothetical protein [uncultured Flavobacterium sp.]
MKINKNIFILSFICIVAINFSAHAQKLRTRNYINNVGTWRMLGTVHAKYIADHDALAVPGPYDYYRKIKIKVTDSPLNLQKMIVRYDDGGAPENIEIVQNIPKNGESRVIDLRGGKRKLKSVEFWYNTKGILNGKADVTVFAMK